MTSPALLPERHPGEPRREVRLPQPPTERGDVPVARGLPANFGSM